MRSLTQFLRTPASHPNGYHPGLASPRRILLTDDAFHHLDRLSLLMMSSLHVKCPVGPHDDPGLDIVILRACNIAKAGSVAVQCSQGHWAEYPCG